MIQTTALNLRLTTLRSAAFIAANVALPHLFHLIPGGGVMFLPIYWFTLVGVMRYGLPTGLAAAVMSPLVGYLLFDAPASFMLPDMLLKGALLCLTAHMTTARIGMNFGAAASAVIMAWGAATLLEWPLMGMTYATQDFTGGMPGLILMSIAAPSIARHIK